MPTLKVDEFEQPKAGDIEQPGAGDIIILVMGNSKSGKSSFIAQATGAKPDIGHGIKSCTHEICAYQYITDKSRKAWLVDTPAFSNDQMSDFEVLVKIGTFLVQMHERHALLYAFIYPHRIIGKRYSDNAIHNLRCLEKLTGPDLSSTILAITPWVGLDDINVGIEGEKELERLIGSNSKNRGLHMALYNGTKEDAKELVDSILDHIDTQFIPIFLPLIDRNVPLVETEIGESLKQNWLRDQARLKNDLESANKEMKTVLSENDRERVEKLVEFQGYCLQKLKTNYEDIKSIQHPLSWHIETQQATSPKKQNQIGKIIEQTNTQERERFNKKKAQIREGVGGDDDISYWEGLLNSHVKSLDGLSSVDKNSLLERNGSDWERFGTATKETPNTLYSKPINSKMYTISEGDHDFDRMTILTDNEYLDTPVEIKTLLVKAIALKIKRSISIDSEINAEVIDRVAAALPDLLKEFSQQLATKTFLGIGKGIGTFVRHYRKHIATSFRYLAVSEEPKNSHLGSEGELSFEEKFAMWDVETTSELQDNSEKEKHTKSESSSHSEMVDSPWLTGRVPDLAKALEFLFATKMFENLQQRIQVSSILTARDEAVQSIRKTITSALIKKSHVEKDYSARFLVNWDILTFLKEQYPEGAPPLEHIISITGSFIDAQALSVGSYIDYVWPMLGRAVMEVLQEVVSSDFNDDVQLLIFIPKGKIKLIAHASLIALADVGEILSWLVVALRACPGNEKVITSSSAIQVMTFSSDIQVFSPSLTSFNIEVVSTEPDVSQQDGTCWHSLFRNPNIASGFPILARKNNEKGLEIPLGMMAALGGADRITTYNDQLLIKGFSTMFVPTERRRDSVLWHFIYSENNARIPYFAAESCPTRVKTEELDYSKIHSSRNFLGWSSSTKLLTGTTDIDYHALRYTGSNFTTAGCAMEKVTISAGKFINIGGTFALGTKDSKLSLGSPEPYVLKMHAASRMHVVMYDTQDRRAWLIDGANALLHLTRSQLAQKPYCNSSILNLQRFPHADTAKGTSAALEALSMIESTDPPIFEAETTIDGKTVPESRWGIKNIVLNLWHILEQMQDHQTQIAGPGMPLRFTDRDKLEGFGFLDTISGKISIRPRVAILKSSGRGWVDFIREIQAVTLMARGFGNLIVPTNHSNYLCSAWTEVPSGYDYLVARISQLRDICEENGDIEAQPLELAQGLYWHQSSNLFEACQPNTCSANCDYIQVLLPKIKLSTKRSPKPFDSLDGAVIFGRSDRFPKWWPRNPRLGPQDSEASCELEDSINFSSEHSMSIHDSGIGSSTSITGASPGTSDRFSPEGSGSVIELVATTGLSSNADTGGENAEILVNRVPASVHLSPQLTNSQIPSRKGKEVVRLPAVGALGLTAREVQTEQTDSRDATPSLLIYPPSDTPTTSTKATPSKSILERFSRNKRRREE